MSGLTLHCGLEGGRRHVPSWSDICGIRLELASFDWRGFTLPVSVVFVFFHGLFIFSLVRSRIGPCCPITSPGLVSLLTSCYMRKHISHCFMDVA